MSIALITGGSRGLGRSMALAVAAQGVDVILTYVSKQAEAEQTAKEIEALGRKAETLRLNVADTASFAAFADSVRGVLAARWQRQDFDFLVNNAGIGIHAPFAQTTEEQFDKLMNIHVKGVFFLTQKLLPLLCEGGRIINVSSGLTRFSMPGFAAYAVMKGAVEVLTRYLARELGDRRIAVNVVAPGAIETDFDGGSVRDVPEVNAFIASQTAMGRAGRAEDIGGAVATLLAPGAAWITGQRVEVSGGMFL